MATEMASQGVAPLHRSRLLEQDARYPHLDGGKLTREARSGVGNPVSALALSNWLDDLPEPGLHLVRDYGLRWYQDEAKAGAERALETHKSCLLVMATSTGKTRTFGAIAADWPGSVLVLAHRDELIQQAKEDLEAITGEPVEVEQGQMRCSSTARLVVGSLDSVRSQKRLDRMGRDRFSLIIFDECHICLAPTYRKILEFFNAKLLGVTATPDRTDKKALGQVFEVVAYVFDIQQAIESGYHVPIVAREVTLGEIDISGVKTQGGDLSAAMLDEAMLKACAGIVSETLKYEPDRQGIVYMPGVRSAELVAQLFNKEVSGSACFVHGGTPTEERREMFRDYKAGKYKYLSNCQVATVGTNLPNASLIVLGRPTKSRLLSTQMCGRGGRVLPGTVDHIPGRGDFAERQEAIAGSAKPNCSILDFVGNCGKHKLVTPVDILGGSYSEVEVKLAKEKLKEGGDVRAMLEAARKELQRIAQQARIAASSAITEIDPFGVLGMKRETNQTDLTFGYRPMTDGQRGFLQRAGLTEKDLFNLSKPEAQRLIGCVIKRRDLGLATYSQIRQLAKFGVTERNISSSRATEALAHIFAQKKAGHSPDPGALFGILHRRREPGEDS